MKTATKPALTFEECLHNGAPAVLVTGSKYGPVRFTFWSKTQGTANFEPFTLRGVTYEGHIAFKRTQNPHATRPVEWDHNNTWFQRVNHTGFIRYGDITPAARQDVWAFIAEIITKLFEDEELMRRTHSAEIARLVEAETAEYESIMRSAEVAKARVKERIAQHDAGAPFCEKDARNGYGKRCGRAAKHPGACDYTRS